MKKPEPLPPVTTTGMRGIPSKQDIWLLDSLGRGGGAFMGRVTPSGGRRFYFRYTGSSGQQVRYTIGSFDPAGKAGMTVADARVIAVELSTLYRSGVRDVREHLMQQEAGAKAADDARRRAEDEARHHAELEASRRLTVRQLFTRWAEVDLQPRTSADGTRTGRKDGGEYTCQQFERHIFPSIGDVAVKDVHRADLMALLDVQKAAGKMRTANVLLSDLKQMLRFATLRDIVDRNVLDGVEKRTVGGRETERDRVLTDDELRTLAAALPGAGLNARSRIAVATVLATACRIGELMNARWEHVDLEGATWTIPPEHSKNQRAHTVHLSAFALDQFQTLHALREAARNGALLPWVFPNSTGRAPVCIKSFGKQLADRQRSAPDKRLSNRSSKTDALALPGGHWTAHDLRRTAATTMGRLGFSADVIDECLNHMIQNRVTRIYVRDRREADQARAFDALGQHLQMLFTGEPQAGNVAPIKRVA